MGHHIDTNNDNTINFLNHLKCDNIFKGNISRRTISVEHWTTDVIASTHATSLFFGKGNSNINWQCESENSMETVHIIRQYSPGQESKYI